MTIRKPRGSTVSRWLPVLIWAGVIFAFSSVPHLGTGLGTWDYVLRKCAHMVEYAVLALLLRRATGSYAWAVALAVAYAVSDEFHQTFVRGRHGSPVDVGIDAIGATLGLAASLYTRRRWSTEK
jgi:VanZ family protein